MWPSWSLTVMEFPIRPVTLQFDLVDGNFPLILFQDIGQHADTCNRQTPKTIKLKTPNDVYPYTLHTFISADAQGNLRSTVQIVPYKNSILHAIIPSTSNHQELSMANNVHKFVHAIAQDMKALLKPTG